LYKIFIVEDDEIIARAVKKHLEGWDYNEKIKHIPFYFYDDILFTKL